MGLIRLLFRFMGSVMCLFDGSLAFDVSLTHVISNETNCDRASGIR